MCRRVRSQGLGKTCLFPRLPSSAIWGAACRQRERGPLQDPAPPTGPRLSCLCPAKPEERPGQRQDSHVLPVSAVGQKPLWDPLLARTVQFPFIPQFCLPAKPAGPLLLTWACPCPSVVPSRDPRPRGQRGHRACPQPAGSTGEAWCEWSGGCVPVPVGEPAGGGDRGRGSLPRASASLLPGGAAPTPSPTVPGRPLGVMLTVGSGSGPWLWVGSPRGPDLKTLT